MNDFNDIIQSFTAIAQMKDEEITDDILKAMIESFDQSFSNVVVLQAINEIVQNLEAQGLNKVEAQEALKAVKDTLHEALYSEGPYSGNKKILIDNITDKLFNIFDSAVEKYHSYSIELPMTVDIDAGAKVPTYAHETDAAADLYAMENTILQAHTFGNKLRTGVKIQLPEGWLAMILPRSSIGAKTPLRLSNSVGLIDSGYRGELGILYDNTSDEPYEINAGDRIAQLLVMPSYRFKSKVVDILADSDRGEGGFGASGK